MQTSLKTFTEKIILGACLLEATAFGRVNKLLESCHFSDMNVVVWEAITTLHEAKKPIDLLTVSKQLSTLEHDKGDGLLWHTTTLINNVCSTNNLEYHALILIELYLKQEIKKLAFIYKRGLIHQNADMAEVMGELYQALLNPLADPLDILYGTLVYLRINFPTESELYQGILDLDNEFNATALKVKKQLGQVVKAETPKPEVKTINQPESWPAVNSKIKQKVEQMEQQMRIEAQETLFFDLNT